MPKTHFKSVALFVFISIVAIVLIPLKSYAGHVSGGDITYRFTADSVCEIELRFYRDCRGVSICNPSNQTRLRCLSSTKAQVLTLKLVSIREVTWSCISAKPQCSPSNTYGTGDGIEEHLYTTTIDFRSSTFSSFIACGDVIVESGICCRTGAITTGPSGNFYTYLRLDLNHLEKSDGPKFSSTPRVNVCCNTATYLDFSAKDTDGDSLSYKLTQPLTGYGGPVSYSGKYSYTTPVQCYDPLGTGKPNPNTNPPIGFYFDPETGENIFTPVKCDDFSVMAVVVEEWRKKPKSKGYDRVSLTHRDVNLVVNKCQSNNPPTVSGPYVYKICLGESLSFNIKSDDRIYVPPPPLPKPPPDTLTMTWNGGISGAKFEIVDTTKLAKTGRFSWRPKKGVVEPGTYRFVVTVNDNHCPSPGAVSRTYTIEVNPTPVADFRIDSIDCGTYVVTAIDDTSISSESYRWNLLDSLDRPITDSTVAHFSSTKTYNSQAKKDTIFVQKGGLYKIYLATTANNCSEIKLLDISLTSKFDPVILEMDTLCVGESYAIQIDTTHSSEISSVNWYNGTAQDTGLTYRASKAVGKKHIYSEVKTRFGCTMYDTITLIPKYKPQIQPIIDADLCDGKTLTVNAIDLNDSGLVMNIYLWSSGVTASRLVIKDGGQYSVIMNNECGSDSQSFEIILHEEYKIDLGPDIDTCDVNTVDIGDTISVFDQDYKWSTGATTSGITVTETGTYAVTVSNMCFTNTDEVEVTMEETPTLSFLDLITYCDSVLDTYDAGNAGAMYKWDDNSTGKPK